MRRDRSPSREELKDVEELLEDTIANMVDRYDDVKVMFKYLDANNVSIDIHVHDSEIGIVLGPKGSRSRALREIFGSIYGRLGLRLNLYVVTPKNRETTAGR